MSAVYIKKGNKYINITGKNLKVETWTVEHYGDCSQETTGYTEEGVQITADGEVIWEKDTALYGVDPENEYDITEETVKEAHRIVQELIKKMGVVVNL